MSRKMSSKDGSPDDRDQVVYDDPKTEDIHAQFRGDQVMATNRRSFARPFSNGFHTQQKLDHGSLLTRQPAVTNNGDQQQYMNDASQFRSKPFNTVNHPKSSRPHSFASVEHNSAFHNLRQSYMTERHHIGGNDNNHSRALQPLGDEENDTELLDEDLYHVLSESHRQPTPMRLDRDGCLQMNETSDSSQRTSEILAQSGSGSGSNSGAAACHRGSNEKSGHLGRQNGAQMILNAGDYDDTYYN